MEVFPVEPPFPRGTDAIPASTTSSELNELLLRGLEELGASISEDQADQLVELARLLSRWSLRIRLTGHRDAKAILRRLVLDAASMEAMLPSFDSLADLGSGAGFPGLVVAILRPTCRVLLVESRAKHLFFQRDVLRKLALENVSLRRGRIERLSPQPQAAVIAQAVAPPQQALQWMLPWALPNGLLIIPGGPTPPEPNPSTSLSASLSERQILHYRVPLQGPNRTLWLARKRLTA